VLAVARNSRPGFGTRIAVTITLFLKCF